MSNQEKTAFELLHPSIQEELYRMHWTELRPIQMEAIYKLFNENNHIIISASTAGGKTEAAFLPILSKIVEDYTGGVHALYVGPLKALINDQFRRLEELCERTDIPVYKWHGDVGQSSKKDLLKEPSGILLITPESIESLFINHAVHLYKIFSHLQYIVVDEMHSFMGTERGAHLKSLLSRLVSFNQFPARIIALSATIGDFNAAQKWLSPKNPQSISLIQDSDSKRVQYLIKGYLRRQSGVSSANTKDYSPIETSDDIRLAEDIIKCFLGKTALVFANSRVQLEFYSDLVRRLLKRKNISSPFLVHHGSLSKSEREETEEKLRSDSPTVAFCSSTLEMGIDVGNVKAIGQIGTPWSVSSLTQRLGRSGRREGETSVMWVYVQEDEPDQRTELIPRLYPEFLQSIAVTELMLQKWCEPPDINRLHISTLIQQVMSIIANKGGANVVKLFDNLVSNGAFYNIDKPVFLQVLKDMGNCDLIEQTPEGDLILGLTGEQIVRSFDFYSAFMSAKEMKVIHNGHNIGSILSYPGLAEDGFLILAGKRWRILNIDTERQEILVEPSHGGKLPHFSGANGPDIHPKVREMMKIMLQIDKMPIYLDPTAKEMLTMARDSAQLASIFTQPFITDGLDMIWFTWTGSRVNRTLWGLGKYYGEFDVEDNDIALTFRKVNYQEVVKFYKNIITNPPLVEELAANYTCKVQEKYEGYLSEKMQSYLFARNCLDIKSAISIISLGLEK